MLHQVNPLLVPCLLLLLPVRALERNLLCLNDEL
jgi:hypothetical protein